VIQMNRKRLIIFFTLIVLSACSILITPCLRKVMASELFTSHSSSESLAQAPLSPTPSSQVTPFLNPSPNPTGTIQSPNTPVTSPFYLQQDFWGKVAIAAISAILTLAVNYTLQALKKKDEPKQQLSYYTSIKKGVVEVEKDFQDKVTILYNEQQIASDLYYVVCNIKNIGTLPVKEEFIRFKFSKGTRFIEIFDPEAEKEMGVEESEDDPKFKLENYEKRYKISSIKRGEEISFRFVVVPTQDESLDMTPHHSNGDVEFIPGAVKEVEDERYQVTRFITFLLIFILIPPVFEVIPFFGSIVAGAARLAILFSIYPSIVPLSEIVSERILRRSYKTEEQIKEFHVSGEDNNIIFIMDGNSSKVSQVVGRESELGIREQESIRELLSQLNEAINVDSNLSDNDKADALEQVVILAKAVTDINDVKMQSSAKTALKVLKAISTGLPSGSRFAETENKLMPLITQILRL